MKTITQDPSVVIPDITERDMTHNIVFAATLISDNPNKYAGGVAVRIPNGDITWLGATNTASSVNLMGPYSKSLINLILQDYHEYGYRSHYIVLESQEDIQTVIAQFAITNLAMTTLMQTLGESRWRPHP